MRDHILASGNSPAYPPVQMLAGAMSGGKRSRVKTAKKWLGAIGDAVGPVVRHAATAAVVRGLSGGKKVNHLKKAKRWLGAIGDAVGPEIRHAASAAVVRGLSGGRKPMAADDPRRRRAKLVGEVMREKGMSLPEASKYIKAQGLKY